MNTALATRDDVTPDGEIVEHAAPLTLFGTDRPEQVVERATKVATVLADVIKQRHLSARIGGRDHIMLEGWTLLGSMTGVFGEIEWTRPITDGWEARAVARTMAGVVVGSAEAMCTRSERTWKSRDEYAIRSMAQTRALSKALRLPLGFIVELAGFAATPAEELDGIEQPERGGGHPSGGATPDRSASAPVQRTAEEQQLLDELAAVPGMTTAQASMLADAVGVEKGTRANADQLRAMLARARQPSSGVPSASAEAGEGSDSPATDTSSPVVGSSASTTPVAPTDDAILQAAGPGAEIVPPKPGSAAYKALPNGTERAKAKAWWDAHKNEPQQASLAEALGNPVAES